MALIPIQIGLSLTFEDAQEVEKFLKTLDTLSALAKSIRAQMAAQQPPEKSVLPAVNPAPHRHRLDSDQIISDAMEPDGHIPA